MLKPSRWTAMIFGGYALLCILGIFLSEAGRIPIDESFFHATQFLAVVIAAAAVVRYLRRHRRAAHAGADNEAVAAAEAEPAWAPLLMKTAFVMLACWLLFVAVVIGSLVMMPSWD